MIKTCGICRGPHFTAECPNQQHISHGDTRVETNPTILTRQITDKPRPLLAPDNTPGFAITKVPIGTKTRTAPPGSNPLDPVTKPVTSNASVTECPRCVTLSRDILTLERDATLYRNKIAALETELRCELNKTRSKPPPLTPAERQRRRRERQAAKIRPAPKSP